MVYKYVHEINQTENLLLSIFLFDNFMLCWEKFNNEELCHEASNQNTKNYVVE